MRTHRVSQIPTQQMLRTPAGGHPWSTAEQRGPPQGAPGQTKRVPVDRPAAGACHQRYCGKLRVPKAIHRHFCDSDHMSAHEISKHRPRPRALLCRSLASRLRATRFPLSRPPAPCPAPLPNPEAATAVASRRVTRDRPGRPAASSRKNQTSAMEMSRSGRYGSARGEILRPLSDPRQQRRSARAYSSIKNESPGSEDDQIPS